MEEKRKAKRIPFHLTLEMTTLYKQDDLPIDRLNGPIDLVNLSKTGIAFVSRNCLPVDYYFNANIQMEAADAVLHSVVRILRRDEQTDGTYLYGCEFVGMADVLSYIFEEYEKEE